jgi:hypothetical protein
MELARRRKTGRPKLTIRPEEVEEWRYKLELAKEWDLSRKQFSPEIKKELKAIEQDLIGFDQDFAEEILRQLAEATIKYDGNKALRLRYTWSIIKGMAAKNQLEILLLIQMIAVHHAALNHAARLGDSTDLEQSETCANILNKLARTYSDQMTTLHRCRSGPELRLVQNVSVADGGQAIVGNVTQNAAEKGQPTTTTSPPLVADQCGMAMPIIENEDQLATAVPHVEPAQETTPRATRRKRRE